VNRCVTEEEIESHNTTVRDIQSDTTLPTCSQSSNSKEKEKARNKPKQIRLCNGEIFFILKVKSIVHMFHTDCTCKSL